MDLERKTAMTTRESVVSNVGASKLTAVDTGARLERVGHHIVRYGLVLVLMWIGAMKFTTYEATGIQPLVANSPVMGWLYEIFSVQALSALLGVTEIAIAVMIALRPVSAIAAAVGSALAVGMFLVTLSFLLSTPGWEPTAGGFPALSVVSGQFLLKDVVLLGAAVWSLGEAFGHSSLARLS
jgi:reactive chlorine resistance protein C